MFANEQRSNISGAYRWTPSKLCEVHNEAELLNCLDEVKEKGRSVRVLASGWSSNHFLNPNNINPLEDDGGEPHGVNIVLKGNFTNVPYEVQWSQNANMMVTIGAGAQRHAIYTHLDTMDNGRGRELCASGECYLVSESQQLGGLIANAVHDTMERAFTPETVAHIRAAVFENDKAVIRDFSDKDGDAFYSFFGGFGLTGIIVAATPYLQSRVYYNRLIYSPGTDFVNDYRLGHAPPALNPPSDEHQNYQVESFGDAMIDLTDKSHDQCAGDIAACFVLFSKEKEKPVVSRFLSRYFRRITDDLPDGYMPVTQDIHNDASALLAKAYCNTPGTISTLSIHAIAVENSVREIKYKAANIANLQREGYPHEAYYQNNVSHTTGPHYIYLWDKAVEFYVSRDQVRSFCAIVHQKLREYLLEEVSFAECDATAQAPPIFADCRYSCSSETAFMTGYYKTNAVSIDIGCTKFHYSNETYKKFVTSVLQMCIKEKIKVRLHAGKFFVYEKDLVHYMYDAETRGRLARVMNHHDPNGVFAPKWLRDLFSE